MTKAKQLENLDYISWSPAGDRNLYSGPLAMRCLYSVRDKKTTYSAWNAPLTLVKCTYGVDAWAINGFLTIAEGSTYEELVSKINDKVFTEEGNLKDYLIIRKESA